MHALPRESKTQCGILREFSVDFFGGKQRCESTLLLLLFHARICAKTQPNSHSYIYVDFIEGLTTVEIKPRFIRVINHVLVTVVRGKRLPFFLYIFHQNS